MKLYQFNGTKTPEHQILGNASDLSESLKLTSKTEPSDVALGNPKDKLIYIFTSGTTGLPKAAVITGMRYFFMAFGATCLIKVTPEDVLYDPLPLYHSAGGVVGLGQMLLVGSTLALRRKFSASGFWPDCVKYNCTVSKIFHPLNKNIGLIHKNI